MSNDPIRETVDYSQGNEAGLMDFMLVVTNGTPGAVVWLESVKPLPDGKHITIPPTKIPTSNPVVIGTQASVPADWASAIVYAYDPKGAPIPANLQLELRVTFAITPSSAHTEANANATSESIRWTVQYDQGDEGGNMMFVLQVRNSPIGATMSFAAVEPNPGGSPIVLPPTVVTEKDFIAGIETTVPAGYSSDIICQYQSGQPLPADFNIVFRVYFATQLKVIA